LYKATCETVVKAFVVDREDFYDVFQPEIRKRMESEVYRKLFMIKDKLLSENRKKVSIENMDHVTANMAKTLNHM